MNRLKLILLYSLGAGVGGFAGALLGSYVADRWFPAEPRVLTKFEWEEEYLGTFSDGEKDGVVEEKEPVVARSPKQPAVEKSKDYARIYKKGKEDLTLEELAKEAAKYKAPSSLGPRGAGLVREDQKKPRVISEEEFFTDDGSTSSLTYTYYLADGVLADETEESVPNPRDILGEEWSTSFGRGTDDPDTVYVYAPAVATKYEVIRLKTSYQEAVLCEPFEAPVVEEKAPVRAKGKTAKMRQNDEDN